MALATFEKLRQRSVVIIAITLSTAFIFSAEVLYS